MITLTRLNNKQLIVNALLIESIEQTPDTMLTLITGKKIMVLEKALDVVSLVETYLQRIGLVNATINSLEVKEGS
ncbi:MAG: flagellar FlbD family protein [Paenibacillaceae bacterium]